MRGEPCPHSTLPRLHQGLTAGSPSREEGRGATERPVDRAFDRATAASSKGMVSAAGLRLRGLLPVRRGCALSWANPRPAQENFPGALACRWQRNQRTTLFQPKGVVTVPGRVQQMERQKRVARGYLDHGAPYVYPGHGKGPAKPGVSALGVGRV